MSDPGDAEGREVCLVDDDLSVLKSDVWGRYRRPLSSVSLDDSHAISDSSFAFAGPYAQQLTVDDVRQER